MPVLLRVAAAPSVCSDEVRIVHRDRDQRISTLRDPVFANVEPGKRFTETERDFIQLMGRWLGGELTANRLWTLCVRARNDTGLHDETPPCILPWTERDSSSPSTSTARSIGLSRRGSCWKSVASLFFEEDRARLCRMEAFFRHPEGVAQWEFRKVRSDGTVLWVRVFVRVLQNQSRAVHSLCVTTSPSETGRGSLRASEERFAKAFKASPIRSSSANWTGRVVDANDAAYQVWISQRRSCGTDHVTGGTLALGRGTGPLCRTVEECRVGARHGSDPAEGDGEIRQILLSSELIELNGSAMLCHGRG